MVLIAANRLNVFSILGEGPKTASEIAAATGTPAPSLEMLLNACVALQLLHKEAEQYRNTATSRLFLVRGSRAFLGDALKYSEDLYPVWGKLEQMIRSNQSVLPEQNYLGSDTEKTRNFVLGMHNRALGIASAVVANLNLEGRTRMLDVGAGPGTYSILLTQKTPQLHAIVFDLPPVVAISKEIIASYNLSERIATVPGNYLEDRFSADNDVVLMSGMMHREAEKNCRLLLQKAYEALVPGGLIVVSDVMFDSDAKTSPRLAALFALNMMLTSQHGSAHATTAMLRWMTEAGFTNLKSEFLPPPIDHVALLTAIRPKS
jgi:precorrin-6B methylase 2